MNPNLGMPPVYFKARTRMRKVAHTCPRDAPDPSRRPQGGLRVSRRDNAPGGGVLLALAGLLASELALLALLTFLHLVLLLLVPVELFLVLEVLLAALTSILFHSNPP